MRFKKLHTFLILYPVLMGIVSYAQPSNDGCSGAIQLSNLSNWCSASGAFTNIGATDDGSGIPYCWSATGTVNDVWLSFTAIGTAVNISINGYNTGGGSLNNPQVELYGGNCSTLTPLGGTCAVAPASNSGFVSINKSGLQIGSVYYLRVDGNNNNIGTFQLCVNNYIPAVLPGQDCITNSFLCNKNTISQTSIVGSGNDPNEAVGTCFDVDPYSDTESNSAWYTWTAATSGSLTFTIFPNIPNDDIDFIVFELIGGSCATKQELRCEASSCPGNIGLNMSSTDITEPPDLCGSLGYPDPNYPNSDNFLQYISMISGHTYALLVNNFTTPQPGASNGYTLQFDGIGEFQGPTALFSASQATGCVGDAFTFTNQSTGALTYAWSFGSGADMVTSNNAGPHTIHYSTPGNKTIVLTITGAGGCQVVYSKTVIINSPAVNLGADISVCSGNTVDIDAGTGFVSYNWSNSQTTQTISVTTAGTYTVTVSDGTCTATDQVVVTVGNGPTLVMSAQDATCGAENGSASVNAQGGSGNYLYIWDSTPTQTSASISNLATGEYKVTVSDNGCTSIDSVTVGSIGGPQLATDSVNANCNQSNGSATVNPSGGTQPYTFVWSTSPVQYTQTASNIGFGTYSVTVTDASNCTSIVSVTVLNIPGFTVSTSATSATCNQSNGSATAIVVGGVSPLTYSWNTTPVQVSQTAVNIPTGTYTVTVSDALNCTSTAQAIIGNNPGITATAIATSASCGQANGSAIVNVNGGAPPYDYSWSTIPIQNSQIAVNLIAGIYIATVSDANNCTDTAKAVIINLPGPPINSSVNNATCKQNNGSATALVSGVGAYNYLWNTVPPQNNATAINLAPGIYIVDANSGTCHVKDTVRVINIGDLTSTGIAVSETCNNKDGKATIIPLGGIGVYNYYWYTTPPQNTATITNLATGNYIVLIRDSLCTLMDTVFVPRANTLTGYTSTSGEHCNKQDGSAYVTMNGNMAVDYKWNTSPAQNTQQAVNLSAGTYIVTVSDGACFGYFIATVPTVKGPFADFSYSPDYLSEMDPTAFFFDRSTGDPVHWVWDFGDDTYAAYDQNPEHAYPTEKGSYNVKLLVQDSWGCTDTVEIIVDVHEISAYYIPNAFTPNKDGLNEVFGPSGVGLETEPYSMDIYDRWGNLIFQTKDIQEGWNGKINNTGAMAPADIYVYKIHLKPFDKGAKKITGRITLIR